MRLSLGMGSIRPHRVEPPSRSGLDNYLDSGPLVALTIGPTARKAACSETAGGHAVPTHRGRGSPMPSLVAAAARRLRVDGARQQVFELSSCSVIATSDRAWALAEDRGGFRLVETVPVHEADNLGVEGIETFKGGSNVKRCVEVVRLAAIDELVAESVAQRRSACVPASVFGEHSGGNAVHPHACLGVVERDVLSTSPKDKQGVG